jgi:type II secretory pathway pseudopilin PulG
LLLRAFGPANIPEVIRVRFFQLLGIEPLPEEGSYIVRSSDFGQELEDEQKFYEELNEAMKRPWSGEEFPDMARWVELNEKPLRLVVEATRRPRYYTPLLASGAADEPGMLIAVLLPILQESRAAARLLAARANLRLHEGKIEEAWQDLLACHRLARLNGQDPTLIGALVCIAIDGIASSGDAALIEHGDLTADQARRMLAELQAIDALPSMADKIDVGERFMYLDSVCTLAQGRTGILELSGVDETDSTLVRVIKSAAGLLTDWDLILREGNSWYDRMVDALERPAHVERAEGMEAINKELKAISRDFNDPKKVLGSFFQSKTPRRLFSEKISDVLAALMLPALDAARRAQDRAMTVSRLTQIGFAMAAYRADHDRYPDKLEDLEPDYMRDIPKDLFNDKSFRYQREGDGFLVHSVGPNMEDNGGKVDYLDREKAGPDVDTSKWDDYRLRIPVE